MSDPSALNIPVNQALTSDMLLGLKPSAPKSRSFRTNISPINKSTFVGGDCIVIELGTGRRGVWLDQSQSFLKFSVQFTANAACPIGKDGIFLDNSAYSFLQRLDVYHSSNLLEQISEWGQLSNFLIDTSLSQSDKAGLSTLIGTNAYSNSVISVNVGTPTALSALNATATVLQTPGDRSGQSVAAILNTNNISTAIPYTFCLPLCSGVVGVNASKMIPMGKLNSPIRLEMYLAPNDNAIYAGTAGLGATWQISNVEFIACYVELSDDSLDPRVAPDESEYISTTTYRQCSVSIPSQSSGELTCMLGFRCASLTALYARFRPFATAAQGNSAISAYRSASINPNWSSYYFRVANSIYPNKPVYLSGANVGTGAESYAELLKSFHALSSSIGNTALTYNSYNVAATATQGWALNYVPISKVQTAPVPGVGALGVGTVDTHANAFAIGLELQSFSNRNDTILSGISTLNSQIFFTGTVANTLTCGGVVGNAGAGYNYTADFFGQMDMILVIQNGIMSAKF